MAAISAKSTPSLVTFDKNMQNLKPSELTVEARDFHKVYEAKEQGVHNYMSFVDEQAAVSQLASCLKEGRNVIVFIFMERARYKLVVDKRVDNILITTYEENEEESETNFQQFLSSDFLFQHLLGMRTSQDEARFVLTDSLPDGFRMATTKEDLTFSKKITKYKFKI